mgnify:FL=1|jgi:hypothetical protein
MKTIDGIPQIIEGVSYYAHLGKPVADYAEKQQAGSGKFGWEINLAVSDEVFEKFQRAGFNVGLRPAGKNNYTEDNVITFYKYHLNYNGTENSAPIVVDVEKNRFEDMIGNGSRVAVQWSAMPYAKGKYKRPIVNAVQVLSLVETGGAATPFTEEEVAF